jgi:7-cyano-7-deazaguanine synthase
VLIGANSVDYSGYPDCRPEFFQLLNRLVAAGTRAGAEGGGLEVVAPLLRLSKAEIVRLAAELGVPLADTWSCYAGGETVCGRCDSCRLRRQGFAAAGFPDPLDHE